MEKTYSTPTSLLTPEQHAIVAHQIEPGETLVANAFAGCGKTSTVVARIERRPLLSAATSGKPVLYVAFNTTTQQEMERRVAHLPTIVQARTYHSLALRFLRHSTSSPVQIGVKPAGLSLYSSAAARILRRYWKDAGNDGWRDEPQQSHLSGRDSLADLAEARRIWSEMLGGNSRNYAWTHDATLKFFCLRAEQSEMWIMSQFSELIVDEAQVFTFFLFPFFSSSSSSFLFLFPFFFVVIIIFFDIIIFIFPYFCCAGCSSGLLALADAIETRSTSSRRRCVSIDLLVYRRKQCHSKRYRVRKAWNEKCRDAASHAFVSFWKQDCGVRNDVVASSVTSFFYSVNYGHIEFVRRRFQFSSRRSAHAFSR